MQDEFASLVHASRMAGYQVLGPGRYRKYDPLTRITTDIYVEGTGPTRNMHVRHTQDAEAILELNVARQNDFSGYKGKEMFQATSIPLIEHRKIMALCGKDKKTGEYDEKRFKRIVNDSDYSKFKVVPGKI
jgi:hypothetical protein